MINKDEKEEKEKKMEEYIKKVKMLKKEKKGKKIKIEKLFFPIEIDSEKAKSQIKLKIEGIEIYFPFEPYEPQKEYMKRIILTLNNKKGMAALESPTGTGKTLCLLCSILGWMKYHSEENINIYYCTRTISQISNVMKELNKTCYKIQTSFLASRKFMCPKISKNNRIRYDISQLKKICELLREKSIKIDDVELMKDLKDDDKENIELSESFEEKKQTKNKELQENKLLFNDFCQYYGNIDKYDFLDYNNLEDIEDLFYKGKKLEFCPYFYNIKKTDYFSNLTFMSYNYILNPYIREKMDLIKENSIIILDEAHNICNIFENLYSQKLTKDDLKKAKAFLQLILNYNNKYVKEVIETEEDKRNEIFYIRNEIDKEINVINEFLKKLDNLEPEKNKFWKQLDDKINKNLYLCDSIYFLDIFKDFNFGLYKKLYENINILYNEEKELEDYYYNDKDNKDFNGLFTFKSIVKKPKKVYEFLKLLNDFMIPGSNNSKDLDNSEKEKEFSFHNNQEKKNIINKLLSYKFILSNKLEKKNNLKNANNKDEGLFFEIYCVDPSYGMKDLLKIKPYSIILTSGTLPIDSLENLLKVEFIVKLKNNHVIENEQFLADIIFAFKNKNNQTSNFSFSFKNREDKNQIIELGNEIYNLIKSVKNGGILVFFQSYDYLSKCYNFWHEKGIITKFSLFKKTIFDLKFKKDIIEDEINEGKKNKNLLLFTVYRGKNSEGINFSDDEARMIICVGIPYANLSDAKVKIKLDFLNEKYEKEKKGIKGWDWYAEDAMIAVNQSLGRIIRNKNDYGIMICFGYEFIIRRNLNLFSKWIQKKINLVKLNEKKDEYYLKLELFLKNSFNKYSKFNFTKDILEDDELEEEENSSFFGFKRKSKDIYYISDDDDEI